jgi:alpha-tubulin suppressor-like RCC1 family protein
LLADDEVRCWGDNQAGRLGTGDTTDSASAVPVVKSYPSPVHRLIVGLQNSCVLAGSPAHMWCWGFLHDFHYHYTPAFVDELIPGTFADVDTTWRLLCALYPAGELRCVGDNAYGQIPGGSQPENDMLTIPGMTDVQRMAIGTWHGCALRADGSVWCWGQNLHGQLGRGFLSQEELPGPVDFNGAVP